jgi:hypothetical protein
MKRSTKKNLKASTKDSQKDLLKYAPVVGSNVWRAIEVSVPSSRVAEILVFPQSSHGASRIF